jgi:hypothetical protein
MSIFGDLSRYCKTMDSTCALLGLSDDDLTAVLLCTETEGLGRLMRTCRFMNDRLRDPAFLRMLALSRGFKEQAPLQDDDEMMKGTQYALTARHCSSIEALAIVEAMRRIESNHIIFRLGSLVMTPPSVERLCRYADLLHKHPRLLLRMDSHTGVGAPPMIHKSHSVRRAYVVADYLDDKGIGSDRVSSNAWGYKVGMKHNWPAQPEFARVELFIAFAPAASDGLTATTAFECSTCLPAWPPYYDEVTPVRAGMEFDHEDKDFDFDAIDDEAGDDDSDDGHIHNGLPVALLPLLQGLQGLQDLGPNDTVTLANGQVVDAAALLQLLQQINGGDDSGAEDDDDEEEEEGEESSEDGEDDDLDPPAL